MDILIGEGKLFSPLVVDTFLSLFSHTIFVFSLVTSLYQVAWRTRRCPGCLLLLQPFNRTWSKAWILLCFPFKVNTLNLEPQTHGKSIPVVLPSFPIKIWDKSVHGFKSHDQISEKITNAPQRFFIYRVSQ